MTAIILTDKQRDQLLRVLGHFTPPIERVDVYGSRARGNAEPGSDIDLVLLGDIDLPTRLRIAGALDDSYLSIHADVSTYAGLKPGRFADEVRRTARPLFSREELMAAPPFRPVDGLIEWYGPSARDVA